MYLPLRLLEMPSSGDGRGGRDMRNRRRLRSVLAAGLLLFGVTEMASSQSPDRSRAMLEAAARGDVDTLQRLLAAAGSLESANAAGETPLLLAVKHNHLAAAIMLIEAGATSMRKQPTRTHPGCWPVPSAGRRCFAT